MWMVVGLGNPGSEYSNTRHNIGFMVLDELCKKLGGQWRGASSGISAELLKATWDDAPVHLVKPMTFMNLSGRAVRPLMDYFKVPPDNLIVVHDEIDLPFGFLKIQFDRGPGGHNGIKSVHQELGRQNYYRFKMGVGRPAGSKEVVDHVLENFNKPERALLPEFLDKTLQAVKSLMKEGYGKAASLYNKPLVALEDRS